MRSQPAESARYRRPKWTFLFIPLSWIRHSTLAGLGLALGYLWFYAIRFRRHTIESNLRLAFGPTLSEADIARLARANCVHYCRTLLEILQSFSWGERDFRERVRVSGLEHIEACRREGKGGFLLTSHLGNWEFAICVSAAHGIPLDVVVKRARLPWAEHLQQWYRRRTGAGVYLEEGTARDILRAISKGRFVGFILDQFMGPPIGLPVKFFGKEAGTAVALALMTDRREEPVIPVYSYRDELGQLHTVFLPPLDFSNLPQDKESRLYVKTQRFNDVLESMIRQHPEQWLWLHRRWKAYRGEPRWVLPTQLATTLAGILMLVVGCVSQPIDSPTGIALPPDPNISVPEFSNTGAVTPAPIQSPVVVAPANPGSEVSAKPSEKVGLEKVPEAKPVQNFYQVLPAHQIPFEVGERLEMALTWMALPAGTATMEVRQGPLFSGRPTFHLWGNVLSSRIVDAVYHVDNTIESFVDAQALIPYKFLLHMVESKQNKETRVSFDHPQRKAFYWAKRVSEKWGNMDVDRVDSVQPQVRDMYSAFYFARAIEYTLNKKEIVRVYENNEQLEVEVLPVANELVVSKVGAFQCWKLALTVKLNNVLKPTGEMYLWVSDDLKRYPVKFDSKLKIGSLLGTLTKIRER